MKKMLIKINDIYNEIINFVKESNKVNGDVILKRGKFSTDAKSIMGVAAINLKEEVVIEYPKTATEFEEYLKHFEVKK